MGCWDVHYCTVLVYVCMYVRESIVRESILGVVGMMNGMGTRRNALHVKSYFGREREKKVWTDIHTHRERGNNTRIHHCITQRRWEG